MRHAVAVSELSHPTLASSCDEDVPLSFTMTPCNPTPDTRRSSTVSVTMVWTRLLQMVTGVAHITPLVTPIEGKEPPFALFEHIATPPWPTAIIEPPLLWPASPKPLELHLVP